MRWRVFNRSADDIASNPALKSYRFGDAYMYIWIDEIVITGLIM